MTAFGWGVWTAAGDGRPLRVVGGLMIAYGLSGIIWLCAPMHQRDVLAAGRGTLEDTMHIVMSGATGIIYLGALAAAAMIGGTIARVVFKGTVHIGFLAAIVAASNAGGAGSVVGDTTTTLMWIDGVSPMAVLHAFVASAAALAVFGVVGALQQDKCHAISATAIKGIAIDYGKIFIVFLILVGAITTSYLLDFPAAGVWIGILLGAMIRKTPWYEMGNAWMGSIFLTALVTCASLRPVEELPAASWQTACSLGFLSAVFDNIPLTKLCLDQGNAKMSF